ncbi:hypothetical protein C0993_004700 [Termitomyces sp. T159_Od127]|nr:hypothetical protein C0993_004700 [Termitomyces sp. T159_Od127]
MPANYDPGVFEQCQGDSGEVRRATPRAPLPTANPTHTQPMGVYGSSTFFQGEPVTPPAHPVPPSSSCTPMSTIANGLVAIPTSSASASGSSTHNEHS